MTQPFEVGSRYRTYQSEYEVLGLEGDKMTVRFTDGTEQRLTVAVQERIWQQVSHEATLTPEPKVSAPAPRRSRSKSTTKPDVAYQLAETPPIVARVILDVFSRTGQWVSHDEIIAGLLDDDDGRNLINTAHAANSAQSPQAIAGRIKAWFGRQFGVNGSKYARQFERTPSQPYGYRPQS
jgi:hypothetical protein